MRLLDVVHTYKPGMLAEPCIIAEVGVNHGGDMERAKRLIHLAVQGGADAVKFQAYKAGSLAVVDSPAYWDLKSEPTTTQHELFAKYDKFWKTEYEELARCCEDAGIDFLCTPFCLESARFLADLVLAFKIASADITCKPLIEAVASYGKPVLLSTGASYEHEIRDALKWMWAGDVPVVLNHCVLNYPCKERHANLSRIVALQSEFPNHLIGYSDHIAQQYMTPMEVAWLLGAVVLEKHFTDDKRAEGNDHYHAMDWEDLRWLKERLRLMDTLIGDGGIGPQETEWLARLHARRSLVTTGYCNKDKMITTRLGWKRPGHGISPAFFEGVLWRKPSKDLPADTVLKWGDLE